MTMNCIGVPVRSTLAKAMVSCGLLNIGFLAGTTIASRLIYDANSNAIVSVPAQLLWLVSIFAYGQAMSSFGLHRIMEIQQEKAGADVYRPIVNTVNRLGFYASTAVSVASVVLTGFILQSISANNNTSDTLDNLAAAAIILSGAFFTAQIVLMLSTCLGRCKVSLANSNIYAPNSNKPQDLVVENSGLDYQALLTA